jgi:ferritin-like metal-binding protein YciE
MQRHDEAASPGTAALALLEIGGYEQLQRVAQRAGDGETAALAELILAQERHAASAVHELFPEAAAAGSAAHGVMPSIGRPRAGE